MHAFPHRYSVSASATPADSVPLKSSGLPAIETAAPKEFDGPGDRWSPENLLTAAVADCLVLGFRAIAAASKFNWSHLQTSTVGTLDRVAGKMLFTRFETTAQLTVPAGADVERGKKLLEKAEAVCLVSNSLSAERHLHTEVVVG
jgi:organic hydroperoxide reductase OsmC/OhrA